MNWIAGFGSVERHGSRRSDTDSMVLVNFIIVPDRVMVNSEDMEGRLGISMRFLEAASLLVEICSFPRRVRDVRG